MKTRKEFIKSFNLKKVHKIGFVDGRKWVERMMWTNGYSDFVFYNNDLILVKRWIDSRGREHYRLSAGYSWYHYA